MDFGSDQEQLAVRKYIISLLVQQAMSDNDFSALEKRYLKFAGESLRLTDTDVAAIRRNPASYEIAPPPDESKRLGILYYMLFMMRVDRKISPEEVRLCYKLGVKLGFRTDMVASLIEVMNESLTAKMPPDAMILKVKPFLN